MRARRKATEDLIHSAVVSHLRQRGVPGLVFWHTPNAPRSPQTGARLKRLGMRKGVADLIIVHNEKIFAMELKAPGGRPTEEQLEFLTELGNQGAYTALCVGLDRALACLESWGLLR